MKKIIFIFVLLSTSCVTQNKTDLYNLSNYQLDPDTTNVQYQGGRFYVYLKDTNYTAVKIDKGGGDSAIAFFYKRKKNGPFTTYVNGHVFFKKNFKNGLEDGIQLWFDEKGDTTEKEFYKDGAKIR
ncbi:hypothetical protein A8C56_11355 [Niabella ginsenosidivorans]|uniref:Nicotinic acid mononucleotide adenyltransferase n=1 Tax=Niabella ginsenosidivorans TaxID=1176587 RepID=A0A1A9I2D7_9BACT|nr:hypothetical protein [Niabella ginsenosidivorans]ANH81495.1 hypothetical protein A8C56_11355 [Niabella ginsenosidivorans]